MLGDLGADARPLAARLAAQGVVVRELTGFGMAPNFLRIGVGTEAEHARLLEGLAAARRGAA